jgi:hypothetical protein
MEEEKKNMDGISSRVWQSIADKHLKPLPRWRFLVKEILLWGLFFIFLLVASISFSFIMLEFLNADWDLYPQLTGSLVDYIGMIFPYFWLICLSVVVVLAYYNFTLTRRGYRFGLLWIFVGTILLSGVLGAVMYFTSLGQWLDSISTEYMPEHRMVLSRQNILWNQPENGLLGGKIMALALPLFIEINSFDNKTWLIVISNRIPPMPLRKGQMIKMVGRQINANMFEAKEIRPWRSHDCPCCGEHAGQACQMERLEPVPVK